MGEGVVTMAPYVISSLGLGSCVVVALYDTRQKIGGLAHVMLPSSSHFQVGHKPYQRADKAIATLLEGLLMRRASRQDIVAKLVGGARMFSYEDDRSLGIGQQNVLSIKDILRREQIPLIGEDVGGHHGRSVEFHLDSGKLIVRSIGREERIL